MTIKATVKYSPVEDGRTTLYIVKGLNGQDSMVFDEGYIKATRFFFIASIIVLVVLTLLTIKTLIESNFDIFALFELTNKN